MTPERIHELETVHVRERQSDRYERLLACMAHARLDEFEQDGGCVGCYSFDEAADEVLASPGGRTLWVRWLKARVRGQ